MSNIMSAKLTEWAELASLVKSLVGSNLASLLRSMSQLSDAELLSLELPVMRQKVTVWESANPKHTHMEAVELPIGDENYEFTVTAGMLGNALTGTDYLEQAVNIIKRDFPSFTATTLDSIFAKAFPEK